MFNEVVAGKLGGMAAPIAGRKTAPIAPPAQPGFRWAYPALLVGAGVVVYANSLSGAFVFDDTAHIVGNARIRQLWPIGPLVTGSRPVVDLTLALNHAAGGLNPWGYHLFNAAVHVAASLMLFGVVRRAIVRTTNDGTSPSRAAAMAFVVACLWAVHPLQTQSVTYVIQRAESLMGLFYLGALYCVLRADAGRHPIRWQVIATMCFLLAMGSKFTAISLPLAALAVERYLPGESLAARLQRRWMLYLGLTAVLAVFGSGRAMRGLLDVGNTAATVGFGYHGISPWGYLQTQPGAILRYLALALWPYPLCLDYLWPPAESFASTIPPAATTVVLLMATGALIVRGHLFGLAAAWFSITLLPTSSIVPIKDTLFEHRMYLPLAGVLAIVVVGADAVVRGVFREERRGAHAARLVRIAVTATAVISLSIATVRRNKDYHSPVAMWQDVAAKRPMNARALEQLGTCFIREARLGEAIEAYRRAVAVDPKFASSWANLGNALLQSDRFAEAAEAYAAAIPLNPANLDLRVNRAAALKQAGKVAEAIDELRAATQSEDPSAPPMARARAHYNLGTTLLQQNRSTEAVASLREAVRIAPDYEKAHHLLGSTLSRLGQPEQAAEHLRRVLELNPDNADARQLLARLQRPP